MLHCKCKYCKQINCNAATAAASMVSSRECGFNLNILRNFTGPRFGMQEYWCESGGWMPAVHFIQADFDRETRPKSLIVLYFLRLLAAPVLSSVKPIAIHLIKVHRANTQNQNKSQVLKKPIMAPPKPTNMNSPNKLCLDRFLQKRSFFIFRKVGRELSIRPQVSEIITCSNAHLL